MHPSLRAQIIRDLDVLGFPGDSVLQDSAFLAAQLCGTSMATFTLVDDQSVHFLAGYGIDGPSIPAQNTFCEQVSRTGEPLVVHDAIQDIRFVNNTFVHCPNGIRFYAGTPVIVGSVVVGAFCVLDTQPRTLTEQQLAVLNVLAGQVSQTLNLRLEASRLRQKLQISSAPHDSVELFPLPYVALDFKGTICAWNRCAHDLLGYDRSEVVGTRLRRLLSSGAPANLQRWIKESSEARSPLQHLELQVQCADGSYKWLLLSPHPYRDGAGKLVGIAGALTDITDRKALEQRLMDANRTLEQLSMTDSLTGVHNRRAFNDFGGRSFAAAKRQESEFSVITIDLDQFKAFNDAFGHNAGDEVLVQAARLMSRAVRKSDFFCRYGGEEFVLILPDTPHAGALVIAEALRRELEQAEWPYRRITASFGVASLTPKVRSLKGLMDRADKHLYEAKADGRNCVRGGDVAWDAQRLAA